MFFKHFACKNQLLSLSVNGTVVGNGLALHQVTEFQKNKSYSSARPKSATFMWNFWFIKFVFHAYYNCLIEYRQFYQLVKRLVIMGKKRDREGKIFFISCFSIHFLIWCRFCFYPFHAICLFLYPLKTENQIFLDLFRGYIKRPVTWNKFMLNLC